MPGKLTLAEQSIYDHPVGHSPTRNHLSSSQISLLETIIQKIPGLIAVYNIKNGQYMFVNDSITKILGYKKEAFLKGGLNFISTLIHPDDAQMIAQQNFQALKKINDHPKSGDNLIVTFEYRMKHKNGSWRWLHTDGVVFSRDPKGQIELVMNLSIDITKRKLAELKESAKRQQIQDDLVKNQQRFQALLNHSADAITLLNPQGKRIYATPSRKNILGYKEEEGMGDGIFSLVHPADNPEVLSGFKQILAYPNNSITQRFRVRHKKGHWVWIEATGTNLLHIKEIQAVVVNYRDVTYRKQIEDKEQFLKLASNILISSLDYQMTIKNILSLIVPALADYCRIAIIDEKGEINEVSTNHIDPTKINLVTNLYNQYKNSTNLTHGVDKILQTGQPEMISKLTSKFLEPFKDNAQLLKTLSKLKIKSYMGVPLKARGKTIGAITFSSIKDNFYYSKADLQFAQEIAYRIALAVDNAMLYRNEQNAVKLRDNFISIASHELKTPVTSIKGFAQILNQTQLPDTKSQHYITRLNDQVDRLTDLINNLLDASKIKTGKLDLNFEVISLVTLLEEIAADIQILRTTHQIVLKGQKDIKIYADRFRLSQVFINLLNNAIKYSPQASKVVVEIKAEGTQVVIKVQDFGIGIPNHILSNIFEPFYQADTKIRQSFGGLGLGLHISQEIVKRHRGEVTVSSQKGVGSTFQVTLPLAQ